MSLWTPKKKKEQNNGGGNEEYRDSKNGGEMVGSFCLSVEAWKSVVNNGEWDHSRQRQQG